MQTDSNCEGDAESPSVGPGLPFDESAHAGLLVQPAQSVLGVQNDRRMDSVPQRANFCAKLVAFWHHPYIWQYFQKSRDSTICVL